MGRIKEAIEIGNVGNSLGGVLAARHEGKYYWTVESQYTDPSDPDEWEEIDEEFYNALLSYNLRMGGDNEPTELFDG